MSVWIMLAVVMGSALIFGLGYNCGCRDTRKVVNSERRDRLQRAGLRVVG